jgi:dipeptidase D
VKSRLLEVALETYRKVFGSTPKVEVVHAGLECGVIGSKYPDMDMLSLGPTIEGAHSPDERLSIPSLKRTWDLLVQLLAVLK